MKRMKKVFVFLTAMVLLLSVSINAFAASITVNGVKGQTYTAYKIFDVTASDNNYSYTIAASGNPWLSVVQDYAARTNSGMTLTLSADGTKYVVDVTTSDPAQEGDFDAASFAGYLIEHIPEGAPASTVAAAAPEGAPEDSGAGTAVINDLDPGYYLVDSNVGSLCILNTTVDQVEVQEKNTLPNIAKKVQEDDDNADHTEALSYKNTAILDVIDTVHYQLTINVAVGADADYVIVDTLPAGFTCDTDSIAVNTTIKNGTTLTSPETWGTDAYTVSYADGVLTITLAKAILAAMDDADQVVITYDAEMKHTAGDPQVNFTNSGNVNSVTLTYKGSERGTDTATVKTYTIAENAVKKVDEENTPLAGVKFVLSRDVVAQDGSSTTQYAQVADGYLTGWIDTSDDASKLETDAGGTFEVKGLDAGSYLLTETETLDGYNLLTDTITVVIGEEGAVTYKLTASTETPDNTITVINTTGTELPSTGGIGTTIFTVVGLVLMIGAAVLLITRKRMSGKQE